MFLISAPAGRIDGYAWGSPKYGDVSLQSLVATIDAGERGLPRPVALTRAPRKAPAKERPIGAPGFEPGTSSTQSLRANQAALRPACRRPSLVEVPTRPDSESVAWSPGMADVEPLRALHYNLDRTGGLQDVVAPPYDVIDEDQRADLEASSPYNVVRLDLPIGVDPYDNAARLLNAWREEDVIVRDEQPALWALEQDYTGPDGQVRKRTGFLARVRVEDYGPGRIRPHERTHPGPKEDRLRLTRATKANLSPIFSLYDDPAGAATGALAAATDGHDPWGQATDDDGTVNRLWRIDDAATIATDPRRARRHRAADRRRPPPLRDRARVRRGDRRRGPAAVRADVPGGARGSRADRVPDPPAAARPSPRPARDPRERHQTRLRHQAAATAPTSSSRPMDSR